MDTNSIRDQIETMRRIEISDENIHENGLSNPSTSEVLGPK